MRTAASRSSQARVREPAAGHERSLPGPVYCDTSALLTLYLPEADSEALNRAIEGRTDLFISDLVVTEVVSALARRTREGTLALAETRRVRDAILEGVDSDSFTRIDLDPDVHRRAEAFLLDPQTAPLRAADALHLALAISGRAGSIATFDRRLGIAARAVGLATYPAGG